MTAREIGRKSAATLTLSLNEFRIFSTALMHVAELVPERTTTSQLTFFLFAAMADIRNTPTTFNEIREAVGPSIGRSLHTTYRVFLDGNRSSDHNRAKGLEWLRTETDPHDNRRKYLHLTEKGKAVLQGVADIMRMEFTS
jgi:hypothetical protein